MGFTTGLLGGITLTTALVHLSLTIHARNRIHQSALLHQQSLVLNNIVEPLPPQPPPTSREVQAGLVETAKDRWNAELERNVKKVQSVDWASVTQRVEEGISGVWRSAFRKSREGAEELGK